MEKSELANQLRRRQLQFNISAEEIIKISSVGDDEIINSYIKCSCCDKKMVNELNLIKIISLSSTCDDFLKRTSIYFV